MPLCANNQVLCNVYSYDFHMLNIFPLHLYSVVGFVLVISSNILLPRIIETLDVVKFRMIIHNA